MKGLLIGEPSSPLLRVGRILTGHGWQVERFGDAVNAAEADLAVVEGGAPETFSRLRQQTAGALIFVLGDFSVEERTRALALGADEFLPRDLQGALMMARIMALLRLRKHQFQPAYHMGGLTVDILHRRVFVAGEEVALSHKEFQLLVLLVRNAGRTLPRSHLIDQLWGGNPATEDNALDVHVSRLRRKLGAARIWTIRGVGYKLNAELPLSA